MRVPHPAAQRVAHLAVHQLVVELVLHPQARAGAGAGTERLGLHGLRVPDRDVHRLVEDAQLAAPPRPCGGRPGRPSRRRTARPARRWAGRRRGRDAASAAAMLGWWPSRIRCRDAGHLDHPAEDVRQRQEEQRGGLVARLVGEDRLPAGHHVVGLGHEVGVGDDAALGPPGGARGVDDGGRRVGGDREAVPFHHVVADAAGRPPSARRRSPTSSCHSRCQPRQLVDHRADGHRVVLVLHDGGRPRPSRAASSAPARRRTSGRPARTGRRSPTARSRRASTRSGCGT